MIISKRDDVQIDAKKSLSKSRTTMTSNVSHHSDSKTPNVVDPYALFVSKKPKPTSRLEFSTASPFTPTYVASNLSGCSDPMSMYNARVKNKQILLETTTRDSRLKKAQETKRSKRKEQKDRLKIGLIGKREANDKGVWKFDSRQAKYHLFLPLHQLWMGYMSELLGLQQRPKQPLQQEMAKKSMPSSSSMHPKLLKADFHGSIVTVSQSKNSCIVGLSGIVIHETENAFKVVTKDDTLKVIPKENSVFSFAVPLYSVLPPSHTSDSPLPIPSPAVDASQALEKLSTVLDSEHIMFQLYGNQFRFRSADRAGRKFKHKETIEL